MAAKRVNGGKEAEKEGKLKRQTGNRRVCKTERKIRREKGRKNISNTTEHQLRLEMKLTGKICSVKDKNTTTAHPPFSFFSAFIAVSARD